MSKFWINFLLILPTLLYLGFGSSISAKSTINRDISSIGYPQGLDYTSSHFLQVYGPTIRKYSQKYGFDWRLVLAIMKTESRFRTGASSYRGAKGLMQIMPVTQSQIAEELGFDEGDFHIPHTNIRGGIYYLGKIYRSFDGEGITEENHIKLTLAAYNAGVGRIADARVMAKYMSDDPNEWESVKTSLSLLSKKYSSLHEHVWDAGRPTNGYYTQWQQTTGYVERIMAYYTEYCKTIPKDV